LRELPLLFKKERRNSPDNLGVYGKREEGIKAVRKQNDLLMQEEKMPERSITCSISA
jgi:hypothetical protein